MTGIEPVTSSLPRKRSTPELHRLAILSHVAKTQSGRRDSNPRPTAWKAVALPTELLPHATNLFRLVIVGRAGFEPTKPLATDLQSVLVDRLSISPV